MNLLIAGNILGFTGAIIMTLIGLIKNKKRFLIAQSGMNIIYIASNLCLGGISGAISNLITLLRNLFCIKWKITPIVKAVFIFFNIGLTAAAGCTDILMWLPVLGNCVFTWYIDTGNMKLFKAICGGCQLLWLIYDLHILNFATAVFDFIAIITNGIAVISLIKESQSGRQKK